MQKFRLWTIIVVNCLASVFMIVFDTLTLCEQRQVNSRTNSESSDQYEFHHTVALFLCERILTTILPVWALIFVVFSIHRSKREKIKTNG
jgi:UDP-N-acetylmuramyl pentapeptide phosphotransferase/UDP-N-acetylglucosamine-1-phosphate transferase